MRILFVDPPGRTRGLNSGLAYLAAVLKESFPLSVLDLNNIPLDLCGGPNPAMPVQDAERKIRAAAEEFRPDVVGVSVKTSTAGISGHIIKFIKGGMPKIITLAGGPHLTLDGQKFIAENKVDFGVIGEGEDIALRLLKALEGKAARRRSTASIFGGMASWGIMPRLLSRETWTPFLFPISPLSARSWKTAAGSSSIPFSAAGVAPVIARSARCRA